VANAARGLGGCLLTALVLAALVGAPGLYYALKLDKANGLLEESQSSLERAASNSLLAAADSLEAAARSGCRGPQAGSALKAAAHASQAAARALEGYASNSRTPEHERLAAAAAALASTLEGLAESGCGSLTPASLEEAASHLRSAASLTGDAAGELEAAARSLGAG